MAIHPEPFCGEFVGWFSLLKVCSAYSQVCRTRLFRNHRNAHELRGDFEVPTMKEHLPGGDSQVSGGEMLFGRVTTDFPGRKHRQIGRWHDPCPSIAHSRETNMTEKGR